MKGLLTSLVVLALVAGSACAHPPPNLTPQQNAAFVGTRVIQSLDVVRDLALSASKQTPPVLSHAHLIDVTTWHRAAITTVHSAPAGWKVTVENGLAQTVKGLDPPEQKLFAPYVALVTAVLKELP